jgi:hypothetical protein
MNILRAIHAAKYSRQTRRGKPKQSIP